MRGALSGLLNGLLVFIHTGRRAAEVQGIRKVDLDDERQAVRVVGKGRKPRLPTLLGPMQQTWDALQRQRVEYPRADEFVFLQYPGWARKALEKIGKAAPGPDLRCSPKISQYLRDAGALRMGRPLGCRRSGGVAGARGRLRYQTVYKHLNPKSQNPDTF